MRPILHTPAPVYSTVTATSAQLDRTLAAGEVAIVCSTVAAWIKIATNPTAVLREAGNTYVPANVPVEVCGPGKVAIVRDAADGHVSLSATAF